jgi:hypothetical protein
VAKFLRSSASFIVGADLFDNPAGVLPDAGVVTKSLGIQPTHAHDAGTPRPGSPSDFRWKHGQWRLESPLPEESELEDHLDWLLHRLLPVRGRISELLQSEPRLRAHFFCGLWFEDYNAVLGLTPKTLQDIGSLGAELNLDIYYEGPRGVDPNGLTGDPT